MKTRRLALAACVAIGLAVVVFLIPRVAQSASPAQAVNQGSVSSTSVQALNWKRSPVWTGNQAGPQDSNGRYWHHPSFDDGTWTSIALPDTAFDFSQNDRYYRAHFNWDGVSPASVYFVSDDGLSIYVNGNLLGTWGNGWRLSGCINNNITCVNYAVVPVQDIPSSLLQPGDNVVAVDLWNSSSCCFYYLSVSVFANEPPPPPKQPVVLVHGWRGYSWTDPQTCSAVPGHYGDPGVASTLPNMADWFSNTLGYDVWIAHLDSGPLFTPPIEDNAQCLKGQVTHVAQATGQTVILVGHSMGGLVSRACLSLSECRENVTEVFTLGSPHAGLNYLLLLKLLALYKAPEVKDFICEWQPALCQFSTEQMLWFNIQNPNREGTLYYFIGGTRTPIPAGWLIYPSDGPNDGVVGGRSAVGQLYPLNLNVVPGSEAGGYWTNETHTELVGRPTYFEPSGGDESQAFRCIMWLLGRRPSADCAQITGFATSAMQAEPNLSAATVDLVGHLASGQMVSHTLQIDTSDQSVFYLSWLSGTLSFTVTQPNGQVITPAYASLNPGVVTYTASLGGAEIPPYAAYAFANTLSGVYTLTIGAGDVGVDGTDYLAFAALESTRAFSATSNADLYQVGQTAVFTGALQGPSGGISGAAVRAFLTRSDGVSVTLSFSDLGGGIYRATYTTPDAPGYLQAAFAAAGSDSGTAFTRQVDHLFAIAPHNAQLAGVYSDRPEDRNADGFDDALALDVGVSASQVGTYTLSAELTAFGQTIAQAMEYTVLATGQQTVTLRFDGWDIRRSRLDGPYTVTNVYLIDLNAGGLPAQMASAVYTTAAYKWQDFGYDRVYLPVILRNR